MTQTIRTSRAIPPPIHPQRSAPPWPSRRQRREQDWKTLVATHRLLSRLVVEGTKHRLPDDADTMARQVVLLEAELEHCYPIRWPRLRAELRLEEVAWWAEEHDDDLLSCRSWQLQNGIRSDRIDVPPPGRVWA